METIRSSNNMDLRRIRYFVAVAEERSFTRAAARLRVSQPPLSQAVRLLEEEIGVPLLTRNGRGVVPTDAGLVFLREARHVLGAVKTAIDETLQAASGRGGTLRIGAVASTYFRLLPAVIGQLRKRLPDASIALTENNSRALIVSLTRGDIDIAILHGPTNSRELQSEILSIERMCAVLPRSHRYANRRTIQPACLSEEDFVLFDREQAPDFFDSIVSLCIRAGFSPKIKHLSRDTPTMLQTVSIGMGITIAAESLKGANSNSTAFCLLDDPSARIHYHLAWRAEGSSRLVQKAAKISLQAC
jgi:DNA-binding transcriptional LysR family regulator